MSDVSSISPAKSWWAVSVFVVTAFLSFLDRQAISLLVDPMRSELQLSEIQIGLLQGLAFAMLYALAGLPLGRWADHGSRRNMLIGGVMVWSVATSLGGVAPNFEWMFVSRLVVGIGEAALVPAAISMIADLMPPERRGRAIAVFLMGQTVGGGASLLLAGVIIDLVPTGVFDSVPFLADLSAWRVVLVVCGAFGVPVVALLLTLREPVRSGVVLRGGAGGSENRILIDYVWSRRRLYVPLYVGFALLSFGAAGVVAWGPTFLMRAHGVTASQVGLLIGVAGIAAGLLGTSLGASVGGMLEKRRRRTSKLLAAVGAAIVCTPTVFVGWAGSLPMAVGLLVFYKVGFAMTGALCVTSIQDLFPNNMRGTATALVAFCNTVIGAVLGPLLVAVATERVFNDPAAVGKSISVVVFPALCLSIACLYAASRELRRCLGGDPELVAVIGLAGSHGAR